MTDGAYVEREGSTATIVLNRPERLNALDPDMASLLVDHLQALAYDETVTAVVITGSGRAFCAGGDLDWAGAYQPRPGAGLHVLASLLHRAIVEIDRTDKPVIAAVNGVAAGAGFSLALACDFRVMDEAAVLRQAYTSSGLSIDGGGTFMLPRMLGLARALEVATFDEPIDARRAAEFGLVTRTAPAGEATATAHALAREFDSRSQISFAHSKRLLRDATERPLEEQLERERAAIVACAGSPEGVEGITAFAEKRKPDFRAARGDALWPPIATDLIS